MNGTKTTGTTDALIAGIVLQIYRKFDYLMTAPEIDDVLEYIDRKAADRYPKWSDPYCLLAEDEFRNYVFRKQITDLSCSRI